MSTWKLPSSAIFAQSAAEDNGPTPDEIERMSAIIADPLDGFKARIECDRAIVGPQITRFECTALPGVSCRVIPRYARDLAYELAADSVRIQAPIPGRRSIGIDIPNRARRIIRLGDVLDSARAPLTFPLGVGTDGETIAASIDELPHLLVAGSTGSGKSSMLNSLLCALLAKSTPDELALVLVDVKQVEAAPYHDIPHLLLPIITDPRAAAKALRGIVNVMEDRYTLAASVGARTLPELNALIPDPLPYILCVIDELADLMMVAGKEVEDAVCRIAQKARAVGVHLVLATQSPR